MIRLLKIIISTIVIIFGFNISLYANVMEYFYTVVFFKSLSSQKSLKIKNEFKFRDGNNYLAKHYLGIYKALTINDKLGIFCVYKRYPNNFNNNEYYIYPEYIRMINLSCFVSENRFRSEYFLKSKQLILRYRLKILKKVNSSIKLWGADEIRYSVKRGSIYINEVLIGLKLDILNNISINIIYDYLDKNRIDSWFSTNIIKTEVFLTF